MSTTNFGLWLAQLCARYGITNRKSLKHQLSHQIPLPELEELNQQTLPFSITTLHLSGKAN